MARGSSALGGLRGFAVAAVAVAARAPATSGCTASILSLAPCLSFTAGNTSAPGASCCSALAGVVRGAPRCLCAVLGGGAASSFGVTVNATRALELPGKCRVQTPPVSQCNAVGAPASSPPAAATPGAGSTPVATVEAPTAPPPVQSTAGAGSKATPATGAVSSDAGVTRSAVVSLSFVVAIASLIAF
ncbi:hypothetical protein GQ55_2G039700 [Panicum hallii var. hallii]|uniref:Bifunctional inhibitor/plant lipid transfer protein/seed storage helical domain-containing protein n=1 Tax=Panicum hallii var. hallii TaxID=1504633 RepID=A0A2T7EL97_9POAL|nr:hypothetical protein GQ55_2G039700 [Panicum hallii var. hallii]